VAQEELQTKTKRKKITYKKQEPQCKLLDAKLLSANSMEKIMKRVSQ
jgi:hypothetical protein